MIFNMVGGGGGSGATLVVSSPANVSVTVSKDDKSYTKNSGSLGSTTFKGLATGTWTVTISGNGQTATKTIEITADYAITIAFFSSSINITYPATSTCVVTNSGGQTVASNTNTGSSTKTWTATVNATGTYTVTATATDGSGKSKSVDVSITVNGQSENLTLAYELVAFLNGATDPAVGGWTGGTVTGSVLRLNPGNGASGRVCSNNELDLRDFTKITFHVKDLTSQDNSLSKVGISSNNTNNSNFITSATMPTGGGAWSTSDVTKVIDITSVDSGYIKIYGSSSNSTASLRIDIDKILLE